MTPEELLKQRVICIGIGDNHYPNSPFKIGQIIEENTKSLSLKNWFEEFNKYPHLFRKREWWEERDEKDMPEYVKESEDGYTWVYKSKIDFTYHNEYIRLIMPDDKRDVHFMFLLPATKEEYENQQQK